MIDKIKVISLILIMFMFGFSRAIFADIICLKNGKTIEGKIIKETDEYVKIRINEVIVTFDRKDIEFVEKKKLEDAAKPGQRKKELNVKEEATIIVPSEEYPTIKKAIEDARAGDIIYVKQGTYDEGTDLKLKSGIEIYGAGPDKTEIILGKLSLCSRLGRDNWLSDIVIEGFTIKTKWGSIYIDFAKNLTIKRCLITGTGSGIHISRSENVQIINCTIVNLKEGITLYYPPVVMTVRNSIISNCGRSGILISAKKERDMIDYRTGKVIKRETGDAKENNLSLYYNDIWGHHYNFYDATRGEKTPYKKDCFPGEGNISKDPKFRGPEDYRLQLTSPCIDAGDPGLEYKERNGSRADIGAFPCLR